jgi:Transposase DDE domain
MSWLDLYCLIRQMTTDWRLGGRACFAALVSAFLYHERFHAANAVDHLARIRRFNRRQAYRKIEKFLHRKTMNLESIWQWLWDHYTAQIKDGFVLVDWTMWKDGRQVLMAALMHAGRCLPFLAVAYQIQKALRSQNQAENAFFLLLSLLKRPGQQITCINDRGFARISLIKQFHQDGLRFITRVCHNTYFASDQYQGLLRDYAIKGGGLVDLGEGWLGKDRKNQAPVRLVVYRGRGHKAAWFIATDRLDLSAHQVASLYARRMGIEGGFRDTKGGRFGWGLKQVGLRSDVQLSVLWAAAMVAYALRMAAGASVVKKDEQAQFNWTKKGPRRSLLAVGRNAVSSGLLKSEEIVKQLPKLALRLSDLKLVVVEKPAKSRAKAAGAHS